VGAFWRSERSVADLPAHSQVTVLTVQYHKDWKMTWKQTVTKWDRSFQFDIGGTGCQWASLNMVMPLEVLQRALNILNNGKA